MNEIRIADCARVVKRHIFGIVSSGIVALVGTSLFVRTLPNVFVSEMMIRVEPSRRSPPAEARSMGKWHLQLLEIQQIINQAQLERVIIENDLYKDLRGKASMASAVDAMRSDLNIDIVKTDVFQLSYRAFDPTIAQKVVGQLAALYTEENLDGDLYLPAAIDPAIEQEFRETEAQVAELEDRMKEATLRFRTQVDSAPRVEEIRRDISRSYDRSLQHYQDLLSKRNGRSPDRRIQTNLNNYQFRALGPQNLRLKPAEPERLKLKFLALALGLVSGAVMFLVVEMRGWLVREEQLVELTSVPILISVPLIAGPEKSRGGTISRFQERLRRALSTITR